MLAKKKKSEQELKVDRKIRKSIALVQPFSGDTVKIPALPYGNMTGSFGTMKKTGDKPTGITWEGCRDRFQSTSEPVAYTEFLFYCKAGTANHVIDFIRTVEELIGLAQEDRVSLKKTSANDIIYVQFSNWWKYRVRRSLLTALLRCGQDYTERTAIRFRRALYSQYYTAATKPAVEQFILKGRNAVKGLKKNHGFSGWHQMFAHAKDDAAVRKYLVKKLPPKPEEVPAPVPAPAGSDAPATVVPEATAEQVMPSPESPKE
jgi:hypothetical protein